MRPLFPLFQSPLDLAALYWKKIIQPNDVVIDATCGNGYDTLKLSRSAHRLYSFDIQKEAIAQTRLLLEKELSPEELKKVYLEQRCHSTFPNEIKPQTVRLIVYNLGYLPGGNKSFTTTESLTLESLKAAQLLLIEGGVISITCYPGHEEGSKEQETLLEYTKTLSPKEWSCCHHVWVNRNKSPSLLLIQKCTPFSVDIVLDL